jgi:hypothetical protein
MYSLNKKIDNGEGKNIEFQQLIVNPSSIDVESKVVTDSDIRVNDKAK